jgi:hypothetical protein
MVWAGVHAASGLSHPHSVSNMFGTWLMGISKDLKPLVLLGAAATCWSLWLTRNAMVFEKKQSSFFAGHLLNYLLASYMGYSSEAYLPRLHCGGISVFGANGQGIFYPGTWVAV